MGIYRATNCTDISSTYVLYMWNEIYQHQTKTLYLNTALQTGHIFSLEQLIINSLLFVLNLLLLLLWILKTNKNKKGDLSIKLVFVLVDSSKKKKKNCHNKNLPHKSRIKFVVRGNPIPNSLPSYFKVTDWLLPWKHPITHRTLLGKPLLFMFTMKLGRTLPTN